MPYNAFIVACYSAHPLTGMLKDFLHEALVKTSADIAPPVVGIFEASIKAALDMVNTPFTKFLTQKRFGIVTTGKYWEKTLSDSVRDCIGKELYSLCFAGVESTGLSAVELHTTPAEEVERRMKEATERLLSSDEVSVVCLGCAGMAGMDDLIKELNYPVDIVDGIKSAIACVALSSF